MNIGIDIRNIGKKRTGDEVVFFNLVLHLVRLDAINSYFLFTDITDTETLTAIARGLGIENKPNFQIISLYTKNRFTWNLFTLPRYLRAHPVDVYHTQYIIPFFVPKKIKIITTIHDVSFRALPQYIKMSDRLFLTALIPLSLRRADAVIAVSEFTRTEIVRWYPSVNPSKVKVVYNAVSGNFSRENYASEALETVRKKYNLPAKFILYLGTLQPRKNVPLLIEAYAELRKKLPEERLLIVGRRSGHNFDVGIDETIRKHALEEEVIFPGYIAEEDKPAVFQLAHVFCFPSLYEGFGVPVLEAMAAGTPVVASRIPVHKEITNGAALLFDSNSRDDLEKKLYQACTDTTLRGGLQEKGKLQVEKFSWENTAKEMMQIYRDIAP